MSAFVRVEDVNATLWSIPVESIFALVQPREKNCDIYLGKDGFLRVVYTTVSLLEVERGIEKAKLEEMGWTAREGLKIANRIMEEKDE